MTNSSKSTNAIYVGKAARNRSTPIKVIKRKPRTLLQKRACSRNLIKGTLMGMVTMLKYIEYQNTKYQCLTKEELSLLETSRKHINDSLKNWDIRTVNKIGLKSKGFDNLQAEMAAIDNLRK